MTETQASINAWQLEHFPEATLAGIERHLNEEFKEFLYHSVTSEEQLVEAADIVILLCHWCQRHGFDLHAAIDAKMAVNRNRQWNIQLDGTGRHT